MPMELKGKHGRALLREDLFNFDLNSELLDHNKKNPCHHVAAKCLWLSQRTRADLQLATGFHCTRVKSPIVEEWLKLKHVLGCLWNNLFLSTTIAIDKEVNAMTYVDGSHATHADSKARSGLFTTMGKCAMMNVSKKLSLVTKSSTETAVVPTGELFPK